MHGAGIKMKKNNQNNTSFVATGRSVTFTTPFFSKRLTYYAINELGRGIFTLPSLHIHVIPLRHNSKPVDKVKLSDSFINFHSMEAYGEMEIQLHVDPFLISILAVDE